MKCSRSEVLHYIADHYGKQAQAMQTIQELGELIIELSKLDTKRCDLNHLAEEIADAEIMLMQMKYLCNLNELTDTYKDMKISRQLERIFEEKSE